MPGDIEIGAAVRADSVRFGSAPDVRVQVREGSAREDAPKSERENLPEEVTPGVTYRDVRVRWRAAASLNPPGTR